MVWRAVIRVWPPPLHPSPTSATPSLYIFQSVRTWLREAKDHSLNAIDKSWSRWWSTELLLDIFHLDWIIELWKDLLQINRLPNENYIFVRTDLGLPFFNWREFTIERKHWWRIRAREPTLESAETWLDLKRAESKKLPFIALNC